MQIIEMIGKRIINIKKDVREIVFEDSENNQYRFFYDGEGQYGCDVDVYIKDICGDLEDLKDVILVAEEVSSGRIKNYDRTETWTFYIFRTIKGTVTISWEGGSNGYYSESVDFEVIKKGGECDVQC